MPKRVHLPDLPRHFTIAEGRAAGLGGTRLRAADLAQIFHGARSIVQQGPPVASVIDAIASMCAAYSPLLKPRQFFSHTTAAMLWGCPLPRKLERALPLHVTSAGAANAVDRKNVIGHRTSAAEVGIALRRGVPVADPVTVFRQMATILQLDDLVAVADHLVLDPAVLDPYDLRPYVSVENLTAGVSTFRGRGCRIAASAILLMRAGAESRPETLLRLLLGRAGFPEPEVNPELYSDDGRWLGRTDLVYRRWKVIIEYDGDQHRTDTLQYEKDIARVEKLERAGWIVLKVRSRGLAAGRADTVARVERALRSRGWRR